MGGFEVSTNRVARWGEIEARRVSLSRREEAHPQGWLGGQDEPQPPAEYWRDKPEDERDERA
jgi:hypothetical protein